MGTQSYSALAAKGAEKKTYVHACCTALLALAAVDERQLSRKVAGLIFIDDDRSSACCVQEDVNPGVTEWVVNGATGNKFAFILKARQNESSVRAVGTGAVPFIAIPNTELAICQRKPISPPAGLPVGLGYVRAGDGARTTSAALPSSQRRRPSPRLRPISEPLRSQSGAARLATVATSKTMTIVPRSSRFILLDPIRGQRS
ncbi:hypothetical protein ACVW1C_005698 [Bradyrhizobium sp. USDA 4011]